MTIGGDTRRILGVKLAPPTRGKKFSKILFQSFSKISAKLTFAQFSNNLFSISPKFYNKIFRISFRIFQNLCDQISSIIFINYKKIFNPDIFYYLLLGRPRSGVPFRYGFLISMALSLIAVL